MKIVIRARHTDNVMHEIEAESLSMAMVELVNNEFKESICQTPSEEEREDVKNIKAKKRKTKL